MFSINTSRVMVSRNNENYGVNVEQSTLVWLWLNNISYR